MKLQAAVIFTSLQNAKFTSIVGYTSCRPTYIESFMTIFGQCINVLNYHDTTRYFTILTRYFSQDDVPLSMYYLKQKCKLRLKKNKITTP